MFHWETTTKGEYDAIMAAVYQELIETYVPRPGTGGPALLKRKNG